MPAWLQSIVDYFAINWVSILKFFIVLIFGYALIKIVVKVIKKSVHRSAKISNMVGDFLASIIKAALLVVYFIIILSLLGVPTDSFVALLTSLGLAISLAAQDSLSNFAGGFIVTTTRPFEEGDFVDIGGTSGVIREITITNTKLTTGDNKVIVIPNSTVSSSVITNYSRQDKRRVDWTFSVAYGSDIDKVKETILEVISSHPLVLKDEGKAPMSRLNAHGSSSLDFVARAWVNSADYWTVYFDVNEEIIRAFGKAGIEVPFSQLDVNIKK